MTADPSNFWMSNGPAAINGFDEVRAPIRVGRYQLLQIVGRGGMGVVFEAIQDEPERRVAVKLMRNAVLTPEQVRRFKRESELLGQLHHPNIAEVIEAGTHVEGRIEVPYYAMQLIESASPITQYAERRQLATRQRVELFVPVCRAVQHAHDHAVVHRDIKPSNVLVDGFGVPRLIDLGLSRLMSDASRPMTASEYLIGTLQYMSPEQLLGTLAQPNTRWDVYSLGVVLYELLLKQLPFKLADANPFAVAQAITQTKATPPRSIDASLPRDLETVLLKAIHKDAEQRYRSPGDLADDLQRWLDERPVKARGDSVAYRLRVTASRTIGRHPVVMGVLICLLAFLAGQPLHTFSAQNGLFDRWAAMLTQWPGHAGDKPFQHVVIVKVSDDAAAVARSSGLKDFDPTKPGGSRPLHGMVIDRLSQAGAEVIAVDMMFRRPTAYDAPLLAGVKAANARGTQVVVGTPEWRGAGPPQIVDELTRSAQFGPILGLCGPDRPWGIDVARLGPTGDAEPTMMTGALAAWHGASADARFQISDDGHVYAIEPAGTLVKVTPFSEVAMPPAAAATQPTRLTDDVFRVWVEVPSTTTLDEATLDVREVLALPTEALRSRVVGKVVVYGDARAGNDRVIQAPDGRMLIGYVAHAIGIESVLAGNTIAPPLRLFGGAGLGVTLESALWALGPLVAVMLVSITPTVRRALAALLVTTGLFVAASLLVYRASGLILSPFTVPLLSTAAGLAMLCCKSLRPTRN